MDGGAENDDTIKVAPIRDASPLQHELTKGTSTHQRLRPLNSHSHPQLRTHNVSFPGTVAQLSPTSPTFQRPEGVRASYMTTTSDASRMSGLSDFPSPPPINAVTPQHVSYLASYFDDDFKSTNKSVASLHLQPSLSVPSVAATAHTSLAPSAAYISRNQTPQHLHPDVEFGDNQSATELAKTLSSPSPQP